MISLKDKTLKFFEPVNIAKTQEEKDAIYRMRYEVYVEELHKNISSADHERKMIIDPEDLHERTHLLYTGPVGAPTGSMRCTVYPYDRVSADFRHKFSLDLFPELAGSLTGEMGRLVIHPRARGKLIVPVLAVMSYELYVHKFNVSCAFVNCAPGLVALYQRLGYRPYEGEMINGPDGLRVPLIFIASDLEYLQAVRSPLASVAKYTSKRDGVNIIEAETFYDRVSPSTASYDTDMESIWEKLQNDLLVVEDKNEIIFRNLSTKQIKTLTEKGHIIEVEPGFTVVQEGVKDRELYIIMDGSFEVLKNDGHRLAILGKGEPFGEIAFFNDEGIRTASVRALEPSRILVLRRKVAEELIQKDPEIASKFFYNLANIMARRTI